MIQMPQILDVQLAVLDEQATPERWKPNSEPALQGADVDDYVALTLETLERIRQLAKKNAPPQRVWDYYRRWHGISLRVLSSVEQFEALGYEVEQSDAFRFAINEAAIAVERERVAAAQNRLAAGHGRGLEEIENAAKA